MYNIENLKKPVHGGDVTALARPSSLYIGTTHGVYVMPERGSQTLVDLSPCLEVLQKPSVEKMRKLGAVLDNGGEEIVYSDSAFWFNMATMKKLINLYHVSPYFTICNKSIKSGVNCTAKSEPIMLFRIGCQTFKRIGLP